MASHSLEKREPGLVLLLSIVTCGLYLLYWYHCVYREFESLTGQTPTGQAFVLDLAFSILTCGIYGIWVDYKIAQVLLEQQERWGMKHAQDTTIITVVLDVAGYVSVFFANFVSSALHQDQLNKLASVIEKHA
ncbi:MAG: DUF4234 domain-containing protein [Myxococcales bacterium]|nr:MAG: DUF4234 domain-containing protein [Myxococcales bacterium]